VGVEAVVTSARWCRLPRAVLLGIKREAPAVVEWVVSVVVFVIVGSSEKAAAAYSKVGRFGKNESTATIVTHKTCKRQY
jgi:hypothetical protein